MVPGAWLGVWPRSRAALLLVIMHVYIVFADTPAKESGFKCNTDLTSYCDLPYKTQLKGERGTAKMQVLVMDGYIFLSVLCSESDDGCSITRCVIGGSCQRYSTFASGEYTILMVALEPGSGMLIATGSNTMVCSRSQQQLLRKPPGCVCASPHKHVAHSHVSTGHTSCMHCSPPCTVEVRGRQPRPVL